MWLGAVGYLTYNAGLFATPNNRALVLYVAMLGLSVWTTSYAAHPERFVGKPPQPSKLPTTAWINQPDQPEEPAR